MAIRTANHTRCGWLLVALPCIAAAPAEDAARLLAKAHRAALQGNFTTADVFLKKILKEHPDSLEALEAEQRLQPNALLIVRELEVGGPPENRVDVYVLAEGFQRENQEQKTFFGLAEQTARLFFQVPTFKRYRPYFNFYAMNICSREDGVDTEDRDYDTALGAFKTRFSQGQVGVRGERVQQFLALDERNDGLAIAIVRRGTLGTGGGGIAVVGGAAGNTIVHEWGHAFGGLLDEYTRDVGYRGPSPRGPNISDTDDPENVPWKHWLERGERGVGVIPGGAGRSTGAWRPTGKSCSMASGSAFCLVCRESLVRNIYGLVSPIDASFPEEDQILLRSGERQEVEVVPMEIGHGPRLEVEFFLASRPGAYEAPPPGAAAADPYYEGRPRRGRGSWQRPRWRTREQPLAVEGEPLSASRKRRAEDRRMGYRVTLDAARLEPGDYLLFAQVTDPTEWLVKEEWLPLLREERVWRVRIESGGGG